MIAFSLELTQGWVDGRYPDITNELGALIGTIFKAWTFREGWKAFVRLGLSFFLDIIKTSLYGYSCLSTKTAYESD